MFDINNFFKCNNVAFKKVIIYLQNNANYYLYYIFYFNK